LPNALCGALGITAAEQREARDAFLLTALLHSRPVGELHFVVARQQDDGTPIQPSPLLLRARGKELARRARYLFGDAPEPPAETPDEGWLLLPSRRPGAGQVETIALLGDGSARNPYAAPNATFSASALNRFLKCPLRFWLQTLYGVDSGKLYEEEKVDMDNAEYGSFMHKVLCAFTQRYPGLRELGEEDGKQELQELLRTAFCKDYGSEWSLPLKNQYELLNASLQGFADWHRRELEKGWQTVAQELDLHVPLSLGEDTAPAVFKMKLDRVDYHPEQQRWRIIDYKTHDLEPAGDYYATLPPHSRFEALLPQLTLMTKFLRGRPTDQKVRWCNLQLPLYAYGLQMQQDADAPPEALRRLFDAEPKARAALGTIPELAYVNLPKKHREVELHPLHNTCKEPLGEDDLELALSWARTLCGFLRRGECLLSAEALELPYQAYGKETLLTEHDPRQLCGLPTPPDHA
ncbi:MAG: PD-(D/E)XK nuclease family protein, partial [Akkermansia sp.]